MKNYWLQSIALGLFISQFAGGYSLEQFLGEVKEKSPTITSSKARQSSAELKSAEAEVLFAPSIYGTLQRAVDQKETSNPATQGTKTTNDSGQLGVSKMTDFGMTAKAYYSASRTDVEGASPQVVTPVWEARPTLEVNQSLMRNFGGSETRRLTEISRAQGALTFLGEEAKQNLFFADAEQVYWRLALAKELVKVTEQSIDRAEKIQNWAKNRVGRSLADRGDLLQADAALAARNLELQLARDDIQGLSRTFNTLRGRKENEVSENLDAPSAERIMQLQTPSYGRQRPDVRAAEVQEQLAKLQQEAANEKYGSTLDLFASLSLNGRDEQVSPTVRKSGATDHPTWAVGLKFQKPIGGDYLNADRERLAREVSAAEAETSRKKFEEEREYSNLSEQVREQQRRLKLLIQIEKAQSAKLNHERERQNLGKSTLFQVLQFEQDVLSAQLSRIKLEAEILRLVSQLKTFS